MAELEQNLSWNIEPVNREIATKDVEELEGNFTLHGATLTEQLYIF